MSGFQGFHHVKLPVADVERSAQWYEEVLGLAVTVRFEEDGELMGVALSDAGGTVQIALRSDAVRAAALSGFDPLAMRLPTPGDVERWRVRLDELGQAHGGVVSGHADGSVLVGLHDPDGFEIRLYADPI